MAEAERTPRWPRRPLGRRRRLSERAQREGDAVDKPPERFGGSYAAFLVMPDGAELRIELQGNRRQCSEPPKPKTRASQ
jgi:hypothetical protein